MKYFQTIKLRTGWSDAIVNSLNSVEDMEIYIMGIEDEQKHQG